MRVPRFRKSRVWIFTPIVLAMLIVIACGGAAPPPTPMPGVTAAPVPVAEATPTPALPAEPRVQRLRVAVKPFAAEVNDPHKGQITTNIIQHQWERLVGLDRHTAEYVPMLATEWTMRPGPGL